MTFFLTYLFVLTAFSFFEAKFVLRENDQFERQQTGWERFLDTLSKLINMERSKLERKEKPHGHNGGAKIRTTTTTTQEPPCCTPSPLTEPCRDGTCVPGYSPYFVYWPVCVSGVCVCITPAEVCNKTDFCCDGSACPKTKICPPAPLNGLCKKGSEGQCAIGSCQFDGRTYGVTLNNLFGTCQ